jgi:hypothetical protein
VFSKGLNQPIEGPLLFAYGLILEKSSSLGLPKVVFGFGAEMLLGNLKICRLAYYLGFFEKVIPFFLLKPIYKLIGKIKKFSENQINFLVTRGWKDRFLIARGPLFGREKHLFKNLKREEFLSSYYTKAGRILNLENVNLLDKIVLLYLNSWVNYMQMRDLGSLGRNLKTSPLIPFDHPLVIKQIFKTPNKFRKLNSWNKQVIRDIFKPYVNKEMYEGPVGSLIIPYNDWFKERQKEVIAYLRTNQTISNNIDLDKYIENVNSLPEPGLNLMRLLNYAVS